MNELQAPWIGHEPDEPEDKEEYIPEYYPECDADYDWKEKKKCIQQWEKGKDFPAGTLRKKWEQSFR